MLGLRAIAARIDSLEKLATERHAASIEKLDAIHSELSLMMNFAPVNRSAEELQSRE